MISSGGLSSRRRTSRIAWPMTSPTPIPPTTVHTKSAAACISENEPATTAATANLKSTSAVPSLTRLSPSMIASARRGTPKRRPIADAASGSVGETTAPSTNAAAQRQVDRVVADDRDGDHRRRHEADREQRDRPQVLTELAQSGVERGRVEERRQDAEQHDVRRHVHVRHARHEPEPEPAEHEQDRVRDAQRLRQQQQADRDHEQQHELNLLVCAEVTQRVNRERSHCHRDGPLLAAASRRACCFTQARCRWFRDAYFCFQYTGTSLE